MEEKNGKCNLIWQPPQVPEQVPEQEREKYPNKFETYCILIIH